jgi:alpha-L-rhamnosidase
LLSTGFLGTPNILDVLADTGYGQVAYDLLLRTEFPSWGYMVSRDATTIWERWNSDAVDVSMNSFNHYALGAVVGFIFRRIAGIAPLQPGFRRIEVRPLLDERLRYAAGIYRSVAGEIATRWRSSADRSFTLELTVPANTTAKVYLPADPSMAVIEGGREVHLAAGIGEVLRSDRHAIVDVVAGKYEFTVLPDRNSALLGS